MIIRSRNLQRDVVIKAPPLEVWTLVAVVRDDSAVADEHDKDRSTERSDDEGQQVNQVVSKSVRQLISYSNHGDSFLQMTGCGHNNPASHCTCIADITSLKLCSSIFKSSDC